MKYSTDKRIEQAVRDRLAMGWTISRDGKHPKLKAPDGTPFAVPYTPSDHRTALNFIGWLRRFDRSAAQDKIQPPLDASRN